VVLVLVVAEVVVVVVDEVVVVLLSLSMEKNKLIREKTRMTHKTKIASLAQESLLSLVLSLSLKPIIAVAVDVSLTRRECSSFRTPTRPP